MIIDLEIIPFTNSITCVIVPNKCFTLILSHILFADDTNIFYSCDNLQEGLRIVNEELRKISTWLISNRLFVNVNKTACMIFSNTNTDMDSNIYINGAIVRKVNSVKFLGILIDDKVTWKSHCKMYICPFLEILALLEN